MISPATMFIEMASDSLKEIPEWLVESQRKELRGFGDVRAQKLGASGLSKDFQLGYELGLATLRVVLRGNPPAVQAGIDL